MTYLEAEGGPTLILNQTTPDGNAEVAATMPETLSLLPTLTPPPPPPPPSPSPSPSPLVVVVMVVVPLPWAIASSCSSCKASDLT